MTDSADPAADMTRAAAELIPALTERLQRHGLGEIEIRQGDLRVRVAAGPSADDGPTPAPGGGVEVTVERSGVGVTATTGSAAPLDPVTSPAVGHFVYADGLGPGQSVSAGTEIGFVEMLGIRHEVRAPADGIVRHLVAESGEPVEYGQLLVEIDRAARD
ncbi:MAG: acetyl-CoA carboxylase biotin carboxyl carrier protein subunit [Chloroflexi bacterium]|nr:MAG: acetyl-CoA carboxylase biotin carboxyl carrier protein subunit [Chloroflexota bacterium]